MSILPFNLIGQNSTNVQSQLRGFDPAEGEWASMVSHPKHSFVWDELENNFSEASF